MSFRGKLFHIMLRYRHVIKGKLKPDVVDKNTSIERLRKETDEMAARLVKKFRVLLIIKQIIMVYMLSGLSWKMHHRTK